MNYLSIDEIMNSWHATNNPDSFGMRALLKLISSWDIITMPNLVLLMQSAQSLHYLAK